VHAHQWQEIDLPLADLSHVVGGHFRHYISILFAKFKFAIGWTSAIFKIICNIQTQGRPGMAILKDLPCRNTFCKRAQKTKLFRLDQ